MKINFLNIKDLLLSQGYIIVSNLVSHEHLDLIHNKMIVETREMIKKNKWGGVGSIKGHIQQNPPRYTPYVFKDILSNSTVLEISRLILGNNFFNDFYSANTNCPGSIAQPVHIDCAPKKKDENISNLPISLVINIPLVKVSKNNGSMEIWPMTHKIFTPKKYIDEKILEERRKTIPPIRADMSKGSILIRDVRTWHRGMPNLSENPRHMLAMIHHAHSVQPGEKIAFSKGCENEILNVGINHHVYFTEDFIDHSIDPTYGAYSVINEI